MGGPLSGRASRLAAILVVAAAGAWGQACQPAEEQVEDGPGAVVPPIPTTFDPEPSVRPVATAAIPAESVIAGAFAHAPHAEVTCSTCHPSTTGHRSHGDLNCTECHTVPVTGVDARATTPDECLACHHTTQTVRDCAGCHTAQSEARLSVEQTLRVTAAGDLVERALPFEHSVHDAEPCAACHEPGPSQAFVSSCATCHDDHHAVGGDCSFCHAPSPLDGHDRTAHLGCAGAGCHSETSDLIPTSRQACLVCHTAQREHEPAGECADCHLLAGGGNSVRTSSPTPPTGSGR